MTQLYKWVPFLDLAYNMLAVCSVLICFILLVRLFDCSRAPVCHILFDCSTTYSPSQPMHLFGHRRTIVH